MNTSYPKITLITPVYNQVDYLEATIQSVIRQAYPNLEYIVVDGGSTDGTLELIKSHSNFITIWISEPDEGMYDALNKGFELSTGSIMGWINSDDILCDNALFTMARLFKDLPHVSWIQGMQSFIDLKGQLVYTGDAKKFGFLQFLNNEYQWIQQESTFWRRDLWDVSGGVIDKRLKLAGDFELWFRFFQHERLYNCNLPIGAWRKREGQLSALHKENYIKEIEGVLGNYKVSPQQTRSLKRIKALSTYINILQKFKVFNVDSLISTRSKHYDIIDNEIYYSYMDKIFKTP